MDRPLGRRLRDLLPRPSQDFLRTLEATERALAGSLNEALPLDGISQEDACLRFYLDMGLLNVFSDVYRWFD